jgi:hypothetical protein
MAKRKGDDYEDDAPRRRSRAPRQTYPQCDHCNKCRAGHDYTFWGGVLQNTSERATAAIVVSVVSKTYTQLNKVEAYLCERCVRRKMIWDSIVVLFCSLCCVAIGIAVLVLSPSSIAFWIAVVWTFVATLGCFGGIYGLFSTDFTSEDTQEVLAKKMNYTLRKLGTGKRQEFFTEAQFEKMTKDKQVKKKIRHKTAAELMEGADDEDDDDDIEVARPLAKTAKTQSAKQALTDSLLDYTRCPECNKLTPVKQKVCKHCTATLP